MTRRMSPPQGRDGCICAQAKIQENDLAIGLPDRFFELITHSPSYVNDSLIRERFLSKNRPKKNNNKNVPPRNLHSKWDNYFVGTQKPLKINDYFETKQELRFYQKRSSFVAEKEGFELWVLYMK